MAEVDLYVDSEDSTGAWNTAGSPPYLSIQDQPTNYIYSTGRNSDSGVYSFQSSGDLGTISSVHLFIYAYSSAVDDFDAIVSGQNAGNAGPAGSWQWVDIDVSSIITTWTEVNAATVYFDRPNTTNDAGVDAAYLQVTYTEGDLQPSVSDPVSSNESLGSSAPLPGISRSSSLSLSELLKLLKSIAPNLYSGVSLSELIVILLSLDITITNSISVSDVASAFIEVLNASASSLVNTNDVALSAINILESLYDTVSILEYVESQLSDVSNVTVNINDVVSILDSVFSKIEIIASISDSVSVSEMAEVFLRILTSTSDSAFISEDVQAQLSSIADLSVNINDVVSILEALALKININISTLDLIGISEVILTQMMILTNTIDVVVVEEFINLAVGMLHVTLPVSDSILLTEQTLAQIFLRASSDGIVNISEVTTLFMNLPGVSLHSAINVTESVIAGTTVPSKGVLTGLVSFKAPRMQFAVSNGV